jgi:Lar family restriction alleviation protein
MKKNKLKPCPFCGTKKEVELVYIGEESWIVYCAACGISTGCTDTAEEAIAVWNRRVDNE